MACALSTKVGTHIVMAVIQHALILRSEATKGQRLGLVLALGLGWLLAWVFMSVWLLEFSGCDCGSFVDTLFLGLSFELCDHGSYCVSKDCSYHTFHLTSCDFITADLISSN